MNALRSPGLAFFLGISLLWPACSGTTKGSCIVFIDKSDAFQVDGGEWPRNPLILVVAINDTGILSLNGIETGTIDDTTILAEKLKVIFEDRAKASIKERSVQVEMNGVVKHEDFEKLIRELVRSDVSPIRVIKNSDSKSGDK
jgi:hypothetical protein